MGRPKQLLPWEHDSLIVHEIKKSLQLNKVECLVVLGAHDTLIKKEIAHLPVKLLYNPDWKSGMGTSISTAIKYITTHYPYWDGVLFSLVDQPLIDVAHLERLIAEFDKNNDKIVATRIKKGIGVPAIFPVMYAKKLVDLKEDYGARYILKEYADTVISIPGQNKVYDIDTMEQYQALLEAIKGAKNRSDI